MFLSSWFLNKGQNICHATKMKLMQNENGRHWYAVSLAFSSYMGHVVFVNNVFMVEKFGLQILVLLPL